jgi:rubrerythrin
LSETTENLAAAFAGESQANRRYLACARKADKEDLPQIAKLFRAAAESETIHALNHLGVMGEIKSTPDNLTKVVSGETYEFKRMYPEFLSDAKQDANKQAAWSFDVAGKVEQVHASLFQKAFDALKGGKIIEVDYYVCGNTVENSAPEKCPICGAPKSKFAKIT